MVYVQFIRSRHPFHPSELIATAGNSDCAKDTSRADGGNVINPQQAAVYSPVRGANTAGNDEEKQVRKWKPLEIRLASLRRRWDELHEPANLILYETFPQIIPSAHCRLSCLFFAVQFRGRR